MPRILGLDHRPIPPHEIVERIKRIDPCLDLMWGEGSFGPPGWWLIYRWPEHDSRQRWVRDGTYGREDAFDWFARLPEDCPVDQAFGYVVNAFRDSAHPEAKRMLGRTGEYNKRVTDSHWAPVIEDAHQMIEDNAATLFKGEKGVIPKVGKRHAPVKRGKSAKEL